MAELFDAGSIVTLHEVRDDKKFNDLAAAMEDQGWVGRPVLVYRDSSDAIWAITGSHRIAAAEEAWVEVPCYVVDLSDEQQEAMHDAWRDEERLEIIKTTNDNDAIAIMQAEIV